MRLKNRIFCSLLALSCTMPFCAPNALKAASITDSNSLSEYGFTVNSGDYQYTHATGKYTSCIFDTDSGEVIAYITSRVWVCRETGSEYNDLILTWTEVDPQEYASKNAFGFEEIYKAYPESVTISSLLPTNVEYCTSQPKSVSTRVNSEKSLVITNRSSSSENMFRVCYDYRHGFLFDGSFDCFGQSTEQNAICYVQSTEQNYTFGIEIALNAAYTNYFFLFNSDKECKKEVQTITVLTNF